MIFSLLIAVGICQSINLTELEPRRVIYRHYQAGSGGHMALLTAEGAIEFYKETDTNTFQPFTKHIFRYEIDYLRQMLADGRIIPEPLSDHHMLIDGHQLTRSCRVWHIVDGKVASGLYITENDAIFAQKLYAVRRRFYMTGLDEWDSDRYSVLYHHVGDADITSTVVLLDKESGDMLGLKRKLFGAKSVTRIVDFSETSLSRLFFTDASLGNIEAHPVGYHSIIMRDGTEVLSFTSSRRIAQGDHFVDPTVGPFIYYDERLACLEQFAGHIDPEKDELVFHLLFEGYRAEMALFREKQSGDFRWLKRVVDNGTIPIYSPVNRLLTVAPLVSDWSRRRILGTHIDAVNALDEEAAVKERLNAFVVDGTLVFYTMNESSHHPVIKIHHAPDRSIVGFSYHTLDKPHPEFHPDPTFHPALAEILTHIQP